MRSGVRQFLIRAKYGLPLQQALPEVLVLPLSEVALLEPVLAMLFDEAFAARYGQTSMLSRLLEMLIILLLRYIVAQGLCQHGMLAALSDSKLAKAMLLMHERKDEPWTVASLAQGRGCHGRALPSIFSVLSANPLWRI